MSVDVPSTLSHSLFRRPVFIGFMQKWLPLYYETELYAEFHRVLWLAIDDNGGEDSEEPVGFLSAAAGAIVQVRPKHLEAVIYEVLWGKHKGWLAEVSNQDIPTFIRRGVELAASAATVYPSRRAVQFLVDMGHFSDHRRHREHPPTTVLLPDGQPSTLSTEAVTAATLAVAVHLAVDDPVDPHKALATYRALKEGVQGRDGHSAARLLREFIIAYHLADGAIGAADKVSRVFHDSLRFFADLQIPIDECTQMKFGSYINERVHVGDAHNARITISAWRQMTGQSGCGVEYRDGDLYVPPDYAAVLQRYAVPEVISAVRCRAPVPLYPMIVRSYLAAVHGEDPVGLASVARSICGLVNQDYTPLPSPPHVVMMFGMFHAILARFPTRLWDMCTEPYRVQEDLVIHNIRDASGGMDSRIVGFDYNANNLYTAILSFFDPSRKHIIVIAAIDMLMSVFSGNIDLQSRYYHQFRLVTILFHARAYPSEEWTQCGVYIDIPQSLENVPFPPVMFLYTLLLGDVLSETQAMTLFLGIRVKTRSKAINDQYCVPAPQPIPPTRGRLSHLQQLAAPGDALPAGVPCVYEPIPDRPTDMTHLTNTLACIEFLSYFPVSPATEIDSPNAHRTATLKPTPAATADTYRGCVRIHDILPYVAPHLKASNLHVMPAVNAWQGAVLPTYVVRDNPIRSHRSPLFGASPILVECLALNPVTSVKQPLADWL